MHKEEKEEEANSDERDGWSCRKVKEAQRWRRYGYCVEYEPILLLHLHVCNICKNIWVGGGKLKHIHTVTIMYASERT